MKDKMNISRKVFLTTSALLLGSSILGRSGVPLNASALVSGQQYKGLIPSHFPSALHAFVWRNWSLVPLHRIAKTVNATMEQIHGLGRWMGLPELDDISQSQWERSYLTVIRRNWHLLPREQLLV